MAAIGFKAVHGGRYSGVQRVTPEVLAAMEEMSGVAPAHNPPYIAAMRLLAEKLPEIPLVAAFETGFHATIPEHNRVYAIPHEWAEAASVRRWGFHGASHRYIARRTAELLGRDDLRIISCHLGGSSSLCAIRNGQSVATSMGMSPQSGLPQNNRVGDFDPFALPRIMRADGQALAGSAVDTGRAERTAGHQRRERRLSRSAAGGRRRQRPGAAGPGRFTASVRHYLGAYLVELGGADAIVFTGGIGENSPRTADGRLPRVWTSWASCSTRRPTPTARGECADPRPGEPRADLGHAHQRRDRRRPAGRGVAERNKAMIIAKVTGSVVATQKVDTMVGHKLLVVEPYRLDPNTARQPGHHRPRSSRSTRSAPARAKSC